MASTDDERQVKPPQTRPGGGSGGGGKGLKGRRAPVEKGNANHGGGDQPPESEERDSYPDILMPSDLMKETFGLQKLSGNKGYKKLKDPRSGPPSWGMQVIRALRRHYREQVSGNVYVRSYARAVLAFPYVFL